MGRKRSVWLTTNYSMERAWRNWMTQQTPAQHLWGLPWLQQAGYEVSVDEYNDPRWTGRWRSAVSSRVGSVPAQFRSLRTNKDAILYASDPSTLAGLCLAASFRSPSRPLVSVIHPLLPDGRSRLRSLRGNSGSVAISSLVYEQILKHNPPQPVALLPWGPDLAFSGYRPTESADFVVSSGKTQRDVVTLLRALRNVPLRARVHIQGPVAEERPPSVTFRPRVPYADVLDDLRGASVVAIPLLTETGTVGLTELNDALALAKPIVMTRNRYIDVDIEAIGCGIWIERGDVDGWSAALEALAADESLRIAMGRRGRAFAEDRWNADVFGRGVVELFEHIAL